MKDLSVIIPVYNAEKHLDRCLNSLKNHKLENIEFIIVDDGSTDKSKDICKKYINDNRFRYVYKENGGQVSAYLKGIEISEGIYIGFVDSDDYVEYYMFNKMLELATKNNADIVICGRYDVNCEKNVISKENNQLEEKIYKQKDLKIIFDVTLPPFNGYHLYNSRWNKIFKRKILLDNIEFCSDKFRAFEDRFIVPACIFSSKSIYLTKECLYYYCHSNEVSSRQKTRPELYQIIKRLMVRQKEMLIKNGLFEEYQTKYEIAQLNHLSLFIDRNIINAISFKEKLYYSKQIIKDKEYRILVKKHKNKLNGKKGVLLKACYTLKSPLLLTLCSYLRR